MLIFIFIFQENSPVLSMAYSPEMCYDVAADSVLHTVMGRITCSILLNFYKVPYLREFL